MTEGYILLLLGPNMHILKVDKAQSACCDKLLSPLKVKCLHIFLTAWKNPLPIT